VSELDGSKCHFVILEEKDGSFQILCKIGSFPTKEEANQFLENFFQIEAQNYTETLH